MKLPAFLRFPALIPACVFFAAVPSVKAATFLPDASGNILVPIGSSDAVIQANSAVTGEKSVRWAEPPELPFPVLRNVTEVRVNVTAPGYSIYTSGASTTQIVNRNSEIIRSPDYVIHFDNSAPLNAVNHVAVVAKGGSTIVNKSWITGHQAAIQLVGPGGRVENSGIIQTGTKYAITAGDGFVLENSSWIRGGILAGAGSFISNSGNIHIGPDHLNTFSIDLGAVGGVGGNTVELRNSSLVERGINMDGTGNVLNAYSGRILSGVFGAEEINVMENGSLTLLGKVSETVITVEEGGILEGNGKWQAQVRLKAGAGIRSVDGSSYLTIGDEGRALQINGNVTHDVGSMIYADVINFSSNRNFIRSASGIYDATHAVINLGDWLREDVEMSYLLVESGGGTVLGGGNQFVYANSTEAIAAKYFSTSRIDENGNLVADYLRDYGALPGLTENQRSLADSLGKSVHYLYTIPHLDLTNALNTYDLKTVKNIFSAILAPAEKNLSNAGLILSRGNQFGQTVRDHLSVERQTDDTVSIPVGFGGGGSDSAVLPSKVGGGNVWGTFSHDWADYDGGADQPDFDGELNSFTVGADYRVLPNLLIGAAADGSESDTDVESLRAAVYGTFGSGSGFHFDFLAGYGVHDGDESDADSIQISAIAGYDLRKGDFKFGPFAGLEWQRVEVDGFGSGGSTASIEDYDLESIRALAGFRTSAEFGRIRPYGSIAYAHEFGDDEAVATASLFGNDFRVTGASQSSAVLLTAGAKFSLMKNLNLDAGYRGDISVGGEGLTVHGASLGLGYEF